MVEREHVVDDPLRSGLQYCLMGIGSIEVVIGGVVLPGRPDEKP